MSDETKAQAAANEFGSGLGPSAGGEPEVSGLPATGTSAALVADSVEERALNLLVQASRADATLRNAVAEVEKWVRRLQEDRASAWQSHEEADVEAQWQMDAKLEAQQALWLIIKALDLNPTELPAGWGASTKPILARIEAIVDEADRLARERDRARHLVKHLFAMTTLEQWRDTGGDDGQGHYEGDYRAAELEEEILSWPK